MFEHPDWRGSMRIERYNRRKNEMSRIETKGGEPTLHSWLNVSAMEEKLQLDRVAMLRKGKPWKSKKDTQLAKDKALTKLTIQLKANQINTKKYLETVIEIMGDY